MAAYQYLCADLLGGTVREEIPFDSVSFSHQLNAPGSFTGTLQLNHPKATTANLWPGATALHVVRDGVVVWSGIMWTAKPSIQNDTPTLEVGGEGWWSYFRKRLIRSDAVFAAVEQVSVAASLVNTALSSTGSLGGISVPTPRATGTTRTITYHGYERRGVGAEVEALAALDGGFDFSVDAAYVNGVVAKTLNFYYPRRGVYSNMRVDLGYNVQEFDMQVDATRTANLVDALGAGTAEAMLISSQQDSSQLTTYPLLEETVSYKADSVQSVLDGHALAELRQSKLPVITLPLKLDPSKPDGRVGSFGVGDTVLVTGKFGWVNVNSYQRIMSYQVDVDNEGREVISLTTAPDALT